MVKRKIEDQHARSESPCTLYCICICRSFKAYMTLYLYIYILITYIL